MSIRRSVIINIAMYTFKKFWMNNCSHDICIKLLAWEPSFNWKNDDNKQEILEIMSSIYTGTTQENNWRFNQMLRSYLNTARGLWEHLVCLHCSQREQYTICGHLSGTFLANNLPGSYPSLLSIYTRPPQLILSYST